MRLAFAFILSPALVLGLSCAPRAQRPDAAPVDVSDETAAVDDRPSAPLDVPRLDTDGDGLCDDTEATQLRTDPLLVDTDGDGLTDLFEYLIYSNANRATDPPQDTIMSWYERPGEAVETVFTFSYRGVGETLFGVYGETTPGIDGLHGEELPLELQAFSASPAGNVAAISDTRFVGVLGATRLTYRLSGVWPTQPPMRCRRAYTITPIIYAEPRGYVYGKRFVIDVRPLEGAFDASVDSDVARPSDVADAMDGGDARAPTPSPWPYVSRGLCLPRPGPCR